SGSRHRHRAARCRARAGRRLPLSARSRAVTALVEPEFWARLASIVLIDLTLAGDNALVIALAVRTLPQRQQFLGRVWGTAGAQGGMLLVLIGIGLSLPIVVWGSGLLAWLMNRFTWIIWLGGGVLGYFAGEMILRDQIVERWIGPRPGWLEAGPIVLALAIA